jgi:serine protease Do
MQLAFFPCRTVVLAIVAMLLVACSPSDREQSKKPQAGAQQSSQASPVPTIELPSFVSLVKREGPAVVNVSTTRIVRQSPQAAPGVPEGDPAFEFFRRFMPQAGPKEFQVRSLGSGFIISQDGYILTNAHVVAETDEVIVRLTTKREYKAKVIGTDTTTDVAVVKIDATGLPMVNIGDPNKLEVGEWVAAIGAPFGFENSVTAGIVSAKGRSLPEETYVPFIQTDVALNPGNSGGPLFNMRGEVVGINSQIYSQTGGYMGLSFAIPMDIAMDIGNQLRTSGKVTRGRIGVQAQELTADLAASFGLKDVAGALVATVEKGGPADKAGIVPGDVILAFDGKPVQTSADLARLVGSTKPGTTVNVDVWRKGERRTVKVTVGELPERVPATASSQSDETPRNRVGLALSELTPQQRRSLQTDYGLLVRGVAGPAQRAGIQPGDVILAINDMPVKSASDFEAQLAKNAGKTAALLIRRGADTLFLPLALGG